MTYARLEAGVAEQVAGHIHACTAPAEQLLQQASLERLHGPHSATTAAAVARCTVTGTLLLNVLRSKIAGTIKRDGLSITKLPAQGRPATTVLELLRAKEARNIRISSGALDVDGRNAANEVKAIMLDVCTHVQKVRTLVKFAAVHPCGRW